ncbi:MAG TPA: type II CAAX endopeptidase family protein [Candidatus Udaeobacter sp.]|nr:type II CAAX endopeptidase family protein [Candidatus Udaeobacter sp.]
MSLWSKLPVSLRAILSGLLIALVAANVWPILLVRLSTPVAALVEVIFLGVYLWWACGGGPPRRTRDSRRNASRCGPLSRERWLWGIIGAISFAVAVHASIVLLFRFVQFPVAAFRRGYDLSFIPTLPLKWLAVIGSAISAGVCEETGFRGYMQRPIEEHHNAAIAILISTVFFALVHLNKEWSLAGMVPIVFGAGLLLGLLAWSSQSLVPPIIAHVVMDIGLFAYWWTGIAGTFSASPVRETGADGPFVIACAAAVISLLVTLLAILRLRFWTFVAKL